jgi:hypothetical protein
MVVVGRSLPGMMKVLSSDSGLDPVGGAVPSVLRFAGGPSSRAAGGSGVSFTRPLPGGGESRLLIGRTPSMWGYCGAGVSCGPESGCRDQKLRGRQKRTRCDEEPLRFWRLSSSRRKVYRRRGLPVMPDGVESRRRPRTLCERFRRTAETPTRTPCSVVGSWPLTEDHGLVRISIKENRLAKLLEFRRTCSGRDQLPTTFPVEPFNQPPGYDIIRWSRRGEPRL